MAASAAGVRLLKFLVYLDWSLVSKLNRILQEINNDLFESSLVTVNLLNRVPATHVVKVESFILSLIWEQANPLFDGQLGVEVGLIKSECILVYLL